MLHYDFHLNGVDVVGDHHKLSLLLLDQGGHSVDTMANHSSTLGGCVLLASSPVKETLDPNREMFLKLFRPLLYCAASFKYPSLSRGGVKRPDGDLIFPSALADKHYGLTALSSRECSTSQIISHIVLFKQTWRRRAPSASPSWPAWSRACTCPSA